MSHFATTDGNQAELITALLHNAPDNGDHAAVREFVHDLADAGLAVMFVHPQSKAPADMRAPRQRNAADKAAQTEARAAGRRNWQRVRSPSGLALATTDADTLDAYLARYIEIHGPDVAVNLAIEVGGSGLVVVDADTPEQVAAFLADGSGTPGVATVSTPGQCDPATGEFVHHDGGHWYFAVPEGVELPEGTGAATLSGGVADGTGYAVLWNRRYVLIPPSTRPEGEYKATGDVHPLPVWLADRITAEAGKRAERAAQRQQHAASGGNLVEQWGAAVTWAEILGGTDWIDTGKPDSCGCSVWTAPGLHASVKSATAHEPGCAVADSDDPCLHIWTDHDIEPFGAAVAEHGPHLTRLRAFAAIHHDNDIGAAMAALDILPDDDDLSFDPGGLGDFRGGAEHQGDSVDALEHETQKRMLWLAADREARRRLSAIEVSEVKMPPVRGLTEFLKEPDDEHEYLIDQVIPAGGTRTVLSAPAKAGKTTLIGNLVRSLADGDPFLDVFTVHGPARRVAILDNEMNDKMMRRWLRSQRIRNTDAVADVQTIRGRVGEFDIRDDRIRDRWARRYKDLGVDFLILDCLAPMIEGLGLNPNTEARKFLQPLDALMNEAEISDALIAHHMGHSSERARGDSNILGWPDGNWKIVRGGDNPDDDGADKFFSAFGRAGEVPGGQLRFDPETRRLSYTGLSRSEAHTSKTVIERMEKVVQVLADKAAEADKTAGPGKAAPDSAKELTRTDLVSAVGGKKEIAEKAIDKAVGDLIFCREHRRARFYRINPNADADRKARAYAKERAAISAQTFPGPSISEPD